MKRLPWLALAATIVVSFSSVWAKDEKWVEARSKNFVVVSNASTQQARNTAIQFEQIRELFQRSLPGAQDHATPVITILAAKDENTLKLLLPEYWEQKGRVHPAGMFLQGLYQPQIAVQLSLSGDNPYQAIYHEYYHSLTIPYYPGLPLWVSEGMAELYGNSEVSEKTARLGMPNVGHMNLLHEQALIPLALLFKVDHASPYYNESSKTSIFYAESWALIHYLMLGDNGTHRQQLVAYLDALGGGADQDAAAAKAFGVSDLGKLQKALQWYVSNTSFYELHAPSPPKFPEADIKIRAISDAEAEAYRGGFLALNSQFKEAETVLKEAAQIDPKLGLAQQNLAVLYSLQNKSAEAGTALDAAIELDPANWYTRFLRANLSWRARTAGMQDSQEEADLRAAIGGNPSFAPAFSLMASHLASSRRDLPEAIELAKKAALLEPGNPSYVFVLAQVLAAAGQYDQAQLLANRLAAGSSEPQVRQNANRFLEYLQNLKDAEARGRTFRGAPGSMEVEANSSSAPEPEENETPEADSKHGKRLVEGTPAEPSSSASSTRDSEAIELLTAHKGVDFTTFLNRQLESVKRNSYPKMPEAARLGIKGKVVLRFRIQKAGALDGMPLIEASSGYKNLDDGAVAAIVASSPFEQLPGDFKGPNVELRVTFFYNMPESER
jgi:TonB family protein